MRGPVEPKGLDEGPSSRETAELTVDDLNVHSSEHLADPFGGDPELFREGEAMGTGDGTIGCLLREYFPDIFVVYFHVDHIYDSFVWESPITFSSDHSALP